MGGILERALFEHAVSVDPSLTARDDHVPAVLAAVDLRAHLPLVIGSHQSGPVAADGDFPSRATVFHFADSLRRLAPEVSGLVDAVGIVRSPDGGDVSDKDE